MSTKKPTTAVATTIAFADLPALGAAIAGGSFEGITTRKDGTHCAVILLPGQGKDLTWEQAKPWAAEQGGEPPSRPVAALLFANAKAKLEPEWHWTADEYNASYAWLCGFSYGYQHDVHKSYEGSAVAVRLIPIADQ